MTIEKIVTRTFDNLFTSKSENIVTKTIEKPVLSTERITVESTKTVTETKNVDKFMTTTVTHTSVKNKNVSTSSQKLDLSNIKVIGEANVPIKLSSEALFILPEGTEPEKQNSDGNVFILNPEQLQNITKSQHANGSSKCTEDNLNDQSEHKTIILNHGFAETPKKQLNHKSGTHKRSTIIDLPDNIKTVQGNSKTKVIEIPQNEDSNIKTISA